MDLFTLAQWFLPACLVLLCLYGVWTNRIKGWKGFIGVLVAMIFSAMWFFDLSIFDIFVSL
jgi:hypothetical protein